MQGDHGYLYELLRKLGLSDFQAKTGDFLFLRPLKVGLVLLGAWLISRYAARWVRRSVRALPERAPLRAGSARAQQRATTLADVLASTVRAVIWAVAVLIVFDQLGINLAPLLAGAGIAGIAIGFGAQTIVRDLLAGIFILVEDQYGVGDSIVIGDTTGTVEEVNLRVTRVRGANGTVWYVPNGEIRRVGNASLDWATATVDVPVLIRTDFAAARGVVEEESARFAADPQWQGVIVDAPEVAGVETVSNEGAAFLRVTVRTLPGQSDRVGRALRTRLVERVRGLDLVGQ